MTDDREDTLLAGWAIMRPDGSVEQRSIYRSEEEAIRSNWLSLVEYWETVTDNNPGFHGEESVGEAWKWAQGRGYRCVRVRLIQVA